MGEVIPLISSHSGVGAFHIMASEEAERLAVKANNFISRLREAEASREGKSRYLEGLE